MRPLLEEIMQRFEDLHKDIERALDGLPQEALDWAPGPDMNSISVLITHTIGAERFLLGDLLAGDPSGRVRDAEFRPQGVGAVVLVERLARSRAYMRSVLDKLSVEDLERARFTLRDGRQVSGSWAALHAVDHTAQHSGHVQLTRQLWQQHHK
jgi:hypothetical protein